jgi:hypothetical protein
MTQTQTNMEVAQTILAQLGGNKFIAMTGSKNFGAGENYLSMKLTRNKIQAQYLTISLNSMDTYDMTFFSVDKQFNRKTKASIEGVYCDMLQDIFTQYTGLYTHL